MASTINAKNTSTGLVMTPDATGQLELQTADTTRMTITSGGNVGIGTSSPSAKLHVSGSSSGNSNIRLTNTFTNGRSWELNPYASGVSDVPFTIRDVTAGADRITIDSSGNVGIGTSTTTDTRLRVKQSADTGAASFSFKVEANANDTGLFIGYRGVGAATAADTCAISATYGTTGAFKPITFLTSDAERMRIDSNGNVLINATSNPTSGAGRLYIGANCSTSQCGNLNNTDTGTASQYVLPIYRNGTITGGITNTNTATGYATSSDYRLKDNVTPMVGALEKVALLNPVNWTWKVDGTDGQGFIAHELQEVIPEAVTGEKDAVDEEGNPVYQGVDTSFLVATLTAAIKELKAELDTVKAELAELKGAA